jgi:hypothetical protein
MEAIIEWGLPKFYLTPSHREHRVKTDFFSLCSLRLGVRLIFPFFLDP